MSEDPGRESSRSRLSHAEMPPRRGETGFQIDSGPPIPPLPPSPKNTDGGWGFGCLGWLLIAAFFIWTESQPSNSVSTSQLGYTASPPSQPAPPQPQFARFSIDSPAPQRKTHVTFSNEQLEIIRVNDIGEVPWRVRQQAVTLGAGGGDISVLASNSTPYILMGTVTVTVGALTGRDRWRGTFRASGGQFDQIAADLDSPKPVDPWPRPTAEPMDPDVERVMEQAVEANDAARPPPSGRRKVYVVGQIATFNGPSLSQNSSAAYEVLDLRVSEAAREQYHREVAAYERYVAEPRRTGYDSVEIGKPAIEHPIYRPPARVIPHR